MIGSSGECLVEGRVCFPQSDVIKGLVSVLELRGELVFFQSDRQERT